MMALLVLSGIILRTKSLLLLKLNPNLRDYLTSVEDDWTWVTNDGRSFENVEIEKIEGNEIVLKHKFGASRLLISTLSDESLHRLCSTSFWPNHDEAARSNINLLGIHPESVTSEENLKVA